MGEPEMKVLTDHGDPSNFGPHRIVIAEGPWPSARLFRLPFMRPVASVLLALKCWWTGFRHPGPGPFVTVASGHGILLALLQRLTRNLKRPRTHVMLDLLLERKRRGIAGAFDAFKMRVFNTAVDAAVVWGAADVDIYSREYGLPREKLIFKPFHITLERYKFEIRDDGYIFAGGNNGRDFETVISALSQVDYPVFIATQVATVQSLAAPFPHITVRAVSPDEFRNKMAGSTLVVEAHPRDFFRTAGHQTFLNAMWMGKPVVMADRKSAIGYFPSPDLWLVVDAGDAAGLREQVQLLLHDRELAARIAERASAEVRKPRFRTLNCMQDIYNIALEIDARKRGLDPQRSRIAMY